MNEEDREFVGIRPLGGNELVQWVIYYNPSDCPGKYVTRKWQITNGLFPAEDAAITDTLDQARAVVPSNFYRLPRFENDDPVIVEVWI